jgi:hypothetical protein
MAKEEKMANCIFSNKNYQLIDDRIVRGPTSPTSRSLLQEESELLQEVAIYIENKLIKEFGFITIHLPETGSISTTILASSDWIHSRKLLLIIQNSSGSFLGIFSRSACFDEGLSYGTWLPYIEKAIQEGYSVLVLRPNTNCIIKDKKIAIPGSESPEKHVLTVWEKVVSQNKEEDLQIFLLSYGNGASLCKELFIKEMKARGNRMTGKPFRIKGFACIEASQLIDPKTDSPEFKANLERILINLEGSTTPFGYLLDHRRSQVGCSCISVGLPKGVSEMKSTAVSVALSMELVFKYFLVAEFGGNVSDNFISLIRESYLYDPITAFGKYGIKFSALQKWMNGIDGEMKLFHNKKISKVSDRIIKPLTKKLQCSLATLLSFQNQNAIAIPTVFISYSPEESFASLIRALKDYIERYSYSEQEIVVWMECLCFNPHYSLLSAAVSKSGSPSASSPSRPTFPTVDWYSNHFPREIQKINFTLLFISSWENPLPLSDLGCNWELFITILTNSKFDIVLSTEEKKRFIHDFLANPNDHLQRILSLINSEKAGNTSSRGTNGREKEMIEEAVQRKVSERSSPNVQQSQNSSSFQIIDAHVKERITEWLMVFVQQYLQEIDDGDEDNKAGSSSSAFSPDDIRCHLALAILFQEKGDITKAEELYQYCIQQQRSALGEDSLEVLSLMNQLAVFYVQVRKDYQQGKDLLYFLLDKCRYVFGDDHELTQSIEIEVLDLLSSLQETIAILAYWKEKWETQKISMGEDHQKTMDTFHHYIRALVANNGKSEALLLYQTLYENMKSLYGEEHPETLEVTKYIIEFYKDVQSNYKEAEKLCSSSYRKSVEALGKRHETALGFMNLLIELYLLSQNYSQAEIICLEYYDLCQNTLGEGNPQTLNALKQLAEVYSKKREYQNALPLYEDCYQRLKNLHGESHWETLLIMRKLAVVYDELQKYEENETLLKEIILKLSLLAISDADASKFPDILTIMELLADSYDKQCKYKEEDVLLHECLKKRKDRILSASKGGGNIKESSAQSILFLATTQKLVQFYIAREKFDRAELTCHMVLEFFQKHVHQADTQDLVILPLVITLAKVFDISKQFPKSESLLQDYVEKYPISLNKSEQKLLTNPVKLEAVLDLRNLLATAYQKQSKYELAESFLAEEIKIRSDHFGLNHISTLNTMHQLGKVYQLQQKYLQAEKIFIDCFREMRIVLGEIHPKTIELINDLKLVYYLQKKYHRVEKLLLNLLNTRKALLGETHKDSLESLLLLANCYLMEGKLKEAKLLAEECIEKGISFLGENHPIIQEAIKMSHCIS